MATHYQYKGKTYSLPDGLSNEDALVKIKSSLGEVEVFAPKSEPQSFMDKAGTAVADMLPDEMANTLGNKFKDFFGTDDPEKVKSQTMELLWNLPTHALGPLSGSGSLGDTVESLPAVGGAVGAMAGGVGAIPGSVAGEAARMRIREASGLPPATGMVQEILGLDPESGEAILTNLGIEGVLGGTGDLMMKASGPLTKGARRSMQNLVQLPEKLRDKRLARGGTKGKELLDRLVDEGIARPGSTRTKQFARAEKQLAEATAKAEGLETALKDQPLKGEKIIELLRTLEDAVPPMRPGGDPAIGGTTAKNAQKVLDDATSFISSLDDGVTLGQARAEKQRITNEISAIFESGSDTPLSKQALSRAGKAWQDAINGSFPELGDAELRRSDLITLTKFMHKALNKAEFAGSDIGAEGTAIGAASTRRWSVPFMIMGKAAALATAGPLSSLSGAGKRLAAKVFENPAMTQSFIRLMGQFRDSTTEETEQ